MKVAARILLLFWFSLGSSLPIAYGQDTPVMRTPLAAPGVVVGDPRPRPIFVPPPSLPEPGSAKGSAVQALVMTVNYNPTGTGRCTVPVTAWPTQARTALEYTLRIWASLLGGLQPMAVDVCWTTNPTGNNDASLLAQASALSEWSDFANAPQSKTFYPVTLANELSNSDLNGVTAEMNIEFNANQPWYFGTDGQVPVGQYDLVSVALHEVGHALGFSGSMNWDDGVGPSECTGAAGIGCYNDPPYVYDRFVQNAHLQILVDSFNNNSIGLGNQLISNTLRFNGPNAIAANGNIAPRLYAPIWTPGSSYSHLDEATFNGTSNALMTPIFNTQEAIHHPGLVTLGILRDLGWGIPDVSTVFVNANNHSYENGTGLYPFNTAEEGVNAVLDGGVVHFTAGTYPGALTIIRPMVLQSPNGTTVLGVTP